MGDFLKNINWKHVLIMCIGNVFMGMGIGILGYLYRPDLPGAFSCCFLLFLGVLCFTGVRWCDRI